LITVYNSIMFVTQLALFIQRRKEKGEKLQNIEYYVNINVIISFRSLNSKGGGRKSSIFLLIITIFIILLQTITLKNLKN